tara:strand:+ start:809 stop:1531 length:723 start_codon:yes stop_codon:yes gene_type:complete
MKKLFLLLLLIPILSCDFINQIPLEEQECCINYKCCDPLKNKYDSDAVIFNDKNYSKKNVLRVINSFGPLEFRKENGNWIIYSIKSTQSYSDEPKYDLLRFPLDSVYSKLSKIEWLSAEETLFKSRIRSNDKYNTLLNRKKPYLSNIILNRKELGIRSFTKYSIENGNNAKAIIYNTTDKIKKDFKIKIKTFNKLINGKLMSEEIVSINQSIQPGQMKVIDFKCNIAGLRTNYVDINIIE